MVERWLCALLLITTGCGTGRNTSLQQSTLEQVEVSIVGKGKVLIESVERFCAQDCTVRVPLKSKVTLLARSTGARFIGWKGVDCGSKPRCQFTANGGQLVVAQFEVPAFRPLWRRRLLSERVQLLGFAVGPSGDVFAGGFFRDRLRIATSKQFVSSGELDAFVARFDGRTGELMWLKKFGDEGDEVITDLAVNKNGEIFIALQREGSSALHLGSHNWLRSGTAILKLNSKAGGLEWAYLLSGSGLGKVAARTGHLATLAGVRIDGTSIRTTVVGIQERSGSRLWVREIEGLLASAVKISKQGTVVLAGTRVSENKSHPVVLELRAADGSTMNTRTFEGGTAREIGAVLTCGEDLIVAGGFEGQLRIGDHIFKALDGMALFIARIRLKDLAVRWSIKRDVRGKHQIQSVSSGPKGFVLASLSAGDAKVEEYDCTGHVTWSLSRPSRTRFGYVAVASDGSNLLFSGWLPERLTGREHGGEVPQGSPQVVKWVRP